MDGEATWWAALSSPELYFYRRLRSQTKPLGRHCILLSEGRTLLLGRSIGRFLTPTPPSHSLVPLSMSASPRSAPVCGSRSRPPSPHPPKPPPPSPAG